MTEEAHIWERRPEEKDEQWKAFKEYLHMLPPRTVRRVCSVTTRDAQAWSNQFEWVARARALDDHYDKVYLAEREAVLKQDAREVTAQHMALLTDARDVAMKELARYRASLGETGGPGMRMPDLIKLTELVVKLDRLVRGEATENTKTSVDMSTLTDEELEQLASLNGKLASGER